MALSVVGAIETIGVGSTMEVRPGVGEIWIIKAVSNDGAATKSMQLIDASLISFIGSALISAENLSMVNIDVPLDRDNWFGLINEAGGSIEFGFRGWKL